MNNESRSRCTRRQMLGVAGGLTLGAGFVGRARARSGQDAQPVPVTNPRAISGDTVEPAWDELFSITVGQKDAELVGTTEKVIQAAVDYVVRRGGGTVRILPGTYRLRNAVYLSSRVRVLGSGPETVLIKEPSTATKLAADSDWYDQEITLVDPRGFRLGDGICLQAKDAETGGQVVLKRTLVARSGNRFKLDRALRENLWLKGEPTASTLFPLLSAEDASGVVIEQLALDGNKAENDYLNGNYAGCIWMQDCKDVTIRKVIARNYKGDGVSWQVCHDVLVEDCHSHDNQGLGFHPGSGSQRPIIRSNRSERNQIGIFFCWGVRFGLAENNTIVGVRESGISIGHRDTDNLIRNNAISRSGKVGILFRDETVAFGPHRNRCEHNRIVDSGPDDGIGIDVRGRTESVTLSRNEIRETRKAMSRIGIRIGTQTRDITLTDNQIAGYAVDVSDSRSQG
jgi:parallel beta helix pectate lyase-like protein